MIATVRARRSHRAREKGMTLLEVVVAMLVIGLGLVMSISMLQSSLRYQERANQQDDAMRLLQEMADRMRANSIAAVNYTFNTHDFAFTAWRSPNISDKCSGKHCSKEKDPAYAQSKSDVDEWLTEVQTVLPQGRAAIDQPDGANLPNQYRIQLQWQPRENRVRAVEAGAQANNANNPAPMLMEIVFTL